MELEIANCPNENVSIIDSFMTQIKCLWLSDELCLNCWLTVSLRWACHIAWIHLGKLGYFSNFLEIFARISEILKGKQLVIGLKNKQKKSKMKNCFRKMGFSPEMAGRIHTEKNLAGLVYGQYDKCKLTWIMKAHCSWINSLRSSRTKFSVSVFMKKPLGHFVRLIIERERYVLLFEWSKVER